jgi:hypothetical protein
VKCRYIFVLTNEKIIIHALKQNTMTNKTQISILRSGTRNQVLNPSIDYKELPQATSHAGHGGTNGVTCGEIWQKVKDENPNSLTFTFFGKQYTAKANWSGSGKSVSYYADIETQDFEALTGHKVGKNCVATISIQSATTIMLQNGKGYYCYICPSLITIL